MNVKVLNYNNEFDIGIEFRGDVIFRSSEENFPFLGNFNTYKNTKTASLEMQKFTFINCDSLIQMSQTEDSDISKDAIKVMFVNKYTYGILGFIKMINLLNESKDLGMIKERVDGLKKQFEAYIKSMLKTMEEFENGTRENKSLETKKIEEISYEEFESPYAKDLYKLKKYIKIFYRKLRKNFGQYLEANIINSKILTANYDFLKDIIVEMSNDICKNLEFKNFEVSSIVKKEDEFIIIIKSDNYNIEIKISEDISLKEINISESLVKEFPYASFKYYNEIFSPIFNAIGSCEVDEDIITCEKDSSLKIGYDESGRYVKDMFVGFHKKDNSKVIMKVYLDGSDNKICNFCTSSLNESVIKVSIEKKKRELSQFQMAKCISTGTKYDGMSGMIDHDGIIEKNGHLEIPLEFKYDNGLKERVIFLDKNIEGFI